MAGETQSANVWPLPKFYFSVTGLPPGTISFQEVTGLSIEATPIEYRHGDSPSFQSLKMPGMGKGNVTMRKGIFINETALWSWLNQINMNTMARLTVAVSLMDETGAPQMVWTLNNAYPIKVTGTELKTEGNEVAVESVEIAFETMVVSAP
jgi:phage tail-like protein